jgi:hypothetical protein
MQVAFTTPVGEVSQFVPTMNGGMVLYVKAKLPIDEKKLTAELPDFTKLLRQAREREAFEAWFNHEAPQALSDTPVVKRETAVNPSAAAN